MMNTSNKDDNSIQTISIKNNPQYLKEYITICYLEWPNKNMPIEQYLEYKTNKILQDNNVISIIGLVKKNKLIGFISLLKNDYKERKDLTPWYATMYVLKEYRSEGYSKILNNAILNEAKSLGYKKIYLKTELVNYYEKFGAIYIENLNDKEKLYYIEL